MRVSVILPAAGLGTRMGKSAAEKAGTSRKQFMQLDGAPIFLHTVRKFAAVEAVAEIILAVRAEDRGWVEEVVGRAGLGKGVRGGPGGWGWWRGETRGSGRWRTPWKWPIRA
jgi:2-C-methyl-D-erythritol 4-phosphate cytidylyltransferase